MLAKSGTFISRSKNNNKLSRRCLFSANAERRRQLAGIRWHIVPHPGHLSRNLVLKARPLSFWADFCLGYPAPVFPSWSGHLALQTGDLLVGNLRCRIIISFPQLKSYSACILLLPTSARPRPLFVLPVPPNETGCPVLPSATSRDI